VRQSLLEFRYASFCYARSHQVEELQVGKLPEMREACVSNARFGQDETMQTDQARDMCQANVSHVFACYA
jgi:hypothetical protein